MLRTVLRLIRRGPKPVMPPLPGSFAVLSSSIRPLTRQVLDQFNRTSQPERSAVAPEIAPAAVPPTAVKSSFLRTQLSRLNWKWRLALAVPFAVLSTGLPAFAAMMIYYTVSFPHPIAMRTKERAPVIRILARDGSVLAERGAAHDYMPLDMLPLHAIGAVVAIEDRRFFEHSGVDPWGFIRAVFANLRAGRMAQGGSTLTQQLAKNLFLSSDRTFSRKFEELTLALWLELRLSKTDILELYLNRVYFGAGAYGIEAASQRYFDKSARALTIAEAAVIAGLLKAPSKYSPLVEPGHRQRARARGAVENGRDRRDFRRTARPRTARDCALCRGQA